MGAVMPEPDYELPMEGEGDTAIYVLARISGEGSDRKDIEGDYRLTKTEIHDILSLSQRYDRFLLVLNTGGPLDLTPIMEISNILLLSQIGMTIGDAFADVLLGRSYPSGKLAATWGGEKLGIIGDFAEEDDTRYKEGVYVGYRYFDSTGEEPLFPFGYGLSYTTFTSSVRKIFLDGTVVTVRAAVTNIGNLLGKEVLQLYVSVPSERLDQPYQTLAAFAKTKELRPGETQEVVLKFSIKELVSFDTERSTEILEPGDYILRMGNSSRTTEVCGAVRLEKEIIVSCLDHAGGEADFSDWKPDHSLLVQEKGKIDQKLRDGQIPLFSLDIDAWRTNSTLVDSFEQRGNPDDEELLELLDAMSNRELAYLCIGRYLDEGSKSIIGNSSFVVAGSAGETTRLYETQGIPGLVMADGPAGLRLSRQYGKDEQGVYAVGDEIPATFLDFIDEQALALMTNGKENEKTRNGTIHDQYCSAIPVGTALAQSWNPDLCEECGDIVGNEMECFGVHIWLAPALNIQRCALCGRNFEYYSEDPLVSGKIAAAVTKGVQKHPGCSVAIKHFACNNQETNRFHSNSIVSERALRDIYLKGFKITVQEAKPQAVMTSYNLLNGEHTSQRADLIQQVLRKEWGFKGIVMSDWVISGIPTGKVYKYPLACASGSIKAGNDIMMPGSQADYDDLMKAFTDLTHPYPVTRDGVKECAYRIASMAHKLNRKN